MEPDRACDQFGPRAAQQLSVVEVLAEVGVDVEQPDGATGRGRLLWHARRNYPLSAGLVARAGVMAPTAAAFRGNGVGQRTDIREARKERLMELASMLAGERFSDAPESVCPWSPTSCAPTATSSTTTAERILYWAIAYDGCCACDALSPLAPGDDRGACAGGGDGGRGAAVRGATGGGLRIPRMAS